MKLSIAVVYLLSCAPSASAQSFYTAISEYPQLLNFTVFYQDNFPLASLLLTNSPTKPHTVLVPNNDAFTNYERDHGYSVTALSAPELESLIRYHVLVGSLTNTNFSSPRGLTAPSLLVGDQYNNRSVGMGLSSSFGNAEGVEGQVVFISSEPQSLKVHRCLSSDANLTTLDGVWDGGRFQEIDQFLTLPEHCSTTIRNLSLSSLDSAINRTSMWDDLDYSQNYTCLGPTNNAFANADHPEISLNDSALTTAMLMHTIPQVLYTNFLEDGQEYLSSNNLTIRVTILGEDLYFNDAKVTNPNVITNNGVLHVVDKVMSPLDNLRQSSSASATASQIASSTSTGAAGAATSKSTAAISIVLNVNWSISSFLSFVLISLLGVKEF